MSAAALDIGVAALGAADVAEVATGHPKTAKRMVKGQLRVVLIALAVILGLGLLVFLVFSIGLSDSFRDSGRWIHAERDGGKGGSE